MACATRVTALADNAEMNFGAVSPDGATLYILRDDDLTQIDAYAWPAGTGPTGLYTATGSVVTGLAADDTGRLFWQEIEAGVETRIRRWDGSASTLNNTALAADDSGGIVWCDGLLYVLAGGSKELHSVDPDTGTATLLADLTGVMGAAGTLVACPTGDLWVVGDGVSETLVHYDISTDTLTSSTTAPVVDDFLVPQANGHVRYWEDNGAGVAADYWDVTPGFTVTAVDCPVVEQFGVDNFFAEGQAYNADLSVNLVQFDEGDTPIVLALYQFDSRRRRWFVGSTGRAA